MGIVSLREADQRMTGESSGDDPGYRFAGKNMATRRE
jgi:hypothetical protein